MSLLPVYAFWGQFSLQYFLHFLLFIYYALLDAGGELGEGEWCGYPMQQNLRGGKMNILSQKILIFCAEQIVKLLSQMKRSSVSDCDFLEFLALLGSAIVMTHPRCQKP
jgi:hypothetical protein